MNGVNNIHPYNNFGELYSALNQAEINHPKEYREGFEVTLLSKNSPNNNNNRQVSLGHILDNFQTLAEQAKSDFNQAFALVKRIKDIENSVLGDLNSASQNATGKQRRDYKYLNNIDHRIKAINAIIIRQKILTDHNSLYHKGQDALSVSIRKLTNQTVHGDTLGFYLSTNESNSKNIRQVLLETPKTINACHIGFSGLHNFDIMVARQSSRGIIVDFNPWNAWIMDYALHLMTICDTRQEWMKWFKSFVRQLETCSNPENCFFSPNFNPDEEYARLSWLSFPDGELDLELTREGGWLSSEENYRFIKQLADKGQIVCITEDIKNTHMFEKAALVLKNESVSIDTLYLSNICHYMTTGPDKMAFQNTVKALALPETLVINCPSTHNFEKDPVQHVCRGSEYLLNPQAPFFELTPAVVKSENCGIM
jgi:hypothetical protein